MNRIELGRIKVTHDQLESSNALEQVLQMMLWSVSLITTTRVFWSHSSVIINCWLVRKLG